MRLNELKQDKDLFTSPVAATCPVIPIFMGKRDSNGLVLSLRSSLASKSNTREKLPLDASCNSSIYVRVKIIENGRNN